MTECAECVKLRDQLAEAVAWIDDIKRVGTLRNKNGIIVEQQRVIRMLQNELGKARAVLMNSRAATP